MKRASTLSAMAVSLLVAVPSARADKPALDITDTARAEGIRRETIARYENLPRSPLRFSAQASTIRTRRFIFARDVALTLPAPPWFDDAAYGDAFELARQAWYQTQSDRVRLIMVFSTFKDGGNALFYVPLANDVQGLGEGMPATIFDSTPDLILDGYAWLGNLGVLESAGDSYLKEAFVHEIAHRWSAYVRISNPVLPQDILLGRQSMHWSFLVDTEDSPMEGNAWVGDGQGMFVTAFGNPPELAFSPLDLYLMGVLGRDQVPPFRVITSWTVVAPADMNVTKQTPPAHRTGVPVTLDATETTEVTIDDVIAGSGPRVPGAISAPIVWPVGIVLLSSGIDQTPLDDLAHLTDRIDSLVEDFAQATGGRITLDVHVDGAGMGALGDGCGSVDDCDRTVADRCVAASEGAPSICARSCGSESPCPAGSCCTLAADRSTPICLATTLTCNMTPPASSSTHGPSLAAMPDPTPSTGPELSTSRARGCACNGSPARGELAWVAVAALLFGRLGRTRPRA
jgi:hypothetical protein